VTFASRHQPRACRAGSLDSYLPAARRRVDIRIIQLMLGHESVQQTQRYLNITDEELRKGLEVSLEATDPEGGHGSSECVTK
jgi:integrase